MPAASWPACKPGPDAVALDENDQLRLTEREPEELDRMRRESPSDRNCIRIWWQERLRAARRVFNDPEQVEKIVDMLDAAEKG
jgi:hypothetical protein